MSYIKLIGNISRNFSNVITKKGTRAIKPSYISQESFMDWNRSLPKIMNEVFAKGRYPSDMEDRIRNMMDYILKDGKRLRGALIIKTYEILKQKEKITEKSLQQIHTLAWAIEMCNAYFLITDDIIDCAATRHGRPCWHLLPHVGSQALNDASLFRSFAHHLLQYNFQETDLYMDLVNLINKSYLHTAIGQYYDGTIYLNKGLESFTMDTFNTIADYKASSLLVAIPISLSIKLANKSYKDYIEDLDFISKTIGRLFQAQNDFLDVYEERTDDAPSFVSGTDIQEGKCSWLAVTALDRCNSEQRTVFQACFGSKEPAHVERIKRLYDQLNLPKLYREYERSVYDKVANKAKEMESRTDLPASLFLGLLDTIRNRK